MQLAVAFSPALMGTLLPKVGMLAGSVALGMLMNGKPKSNRARLSDLKVSSSTYGKGIPLVWGTMRCTGNMIWATDIVETRRFVGQKGKAKSEKKWEMGKAQEVLEYYGNYAMALCAGPKADVIRVWADSNLIYDKYNPDKAKRVGFSQEDGGGKANKGANKKGVDMNGGRFQFRFYSGSEKQMPDPYMQKLSGEDKTPAYRGLCYLMFEEMPLWDFGNRLPTITAEVVPRKERQIKVLPFDNIEGEFNDVSDAWTSDFAAYIDPLRGRLYHVRSYQDDGIRVFNFWKGREINRFDVPTYSWYSRYGSGPYVNKPGIMGIGGDGKLWANGPAMDSSLMYRIDPNDGSIIEVKGNPPGGPLVWSVIREPSWWYPQGMRIPYSLKVTPMAVTDAYGSVSYKTLIQPFLMGPGTYDEIEGFRASNYQFGILGGRRMKMLQPGAPGPQQEFFAVYDTHIAKFSATTFPTLPAEGGTYVWPSTAPVDPLWFKVPGATDYEFSNMFPPAEGSYKFVQPPIWSQGAELHLIVYFKNYLSSPSAPKRTGWYASGVKPNGKVVWDRQLTTGSATTDLARNMRGEYSPIPIIVGSRWAFIDGGRVIWINVKNGDIEIENIPISYLSLYGPQFFIENEGAFIVYGTSTADPAQTVKGWFKIWVQKFTQVDTSLIEVITDVSNRVGIPSSKLNFVGLTDQTFTGFIMEEPTTPRDIVENLSSVYFFDAVESDLTLKFFSRGRNSLVTIPQSALGVVNEDTGDYYTETRLQEVDLPQTCVVSFINPKHKYQTGTQHFRRPNSPYSVMQSREKVDINVPIAMTPRDAKHMAERIVTASWSERVKHEYMLPWTYLKYDAADVFKVQLDNGHLFSDRMLSMEVGANYAINITAVLQDDYDYVAYGDEVEGEGVVIIEKDTMPLTKPMLLDIPYTEDTDRIENSGLPLYWAAAPYDPGFQSASIMIKDPPQDYKGYNSSALEAVWGRVEGVVPAPPNGSFATDDNTVITLVPTFNFEDVYVYEWAAIPSSEWPSYANMILIGNEIILFRDVEVLLNGRVELSHLIRGHRGTENEAYTHVAREEFVILNTEAQRQVTIDTASLNEDLTAKISTLNPYQLAAPTDVVTFKANALRPYAVGHVKRSDSAGQMVFTWQRRTRYSGSMKDGIGTVGLNEGSELYRVFICTTAVDESTFDPGATSSYVQTADVTTTSFTYTSSMMAADSVTSTDTVWLVVYQMSLEVSYGFPRVTKLETTDPTYR